MVYNVFQQSEKLHCICIPRVISRRLLRLPQIYFLCNFRAAIKAEEPLAYVITVFLGIHS